MSLCKLLIEFEIYSVFKMSLIMKNSRLFKSFYADFTLKFQDNYLINLGVPIETSLHQDLFDI